MIKMNKWLEMVQRNSCCQHHTISVWQDIFTRDMPFQRKILFDMLFKPLLEHPRGKSYYLPNQQIEMRNHGGILFGSYKEGGV